MLSIRAFEAAARHGGFTKAADELCVSSGAVAHQIRQLEEWLGVDLFVRRPRSVDLTESGRIYYETVRNALEEVERASVNMRRWAGEGEVTVTAMPSFVTRWLMPRLGTFRRQYPDVEVRLLASVPPVDFVRDRVDIAIRLGAGPYPDLISDPLLDEHFFPVISPTLLTEYGDITDPAALLDFTLLHDEFEPRIPDQIDWPRWFSAHGVKTSGQRQLSGLRFSHSYLTLDAAAAGQGVALASSVLAGDAVQLGTLAVGYRGALRGPYRYQVLRRKTSETRRPVKQFISWLLDEADAFSKIVKF